MTMDIRWTTRCGAVPLLLFATIWGCGDSSRPTSPSATPVAASVLAALTPDGVISLKTSAPVPGSPVDNAETEDLSPILTAANSSPRFVDGADLTYRFEVYVVEDSGAMTRVDVGTVDQTQNTTSYKVKNKLGQAMTHMWRARAVIGDEKGPWSDTATFVTPTLLGTPIPVSPIDGVTTSDTNPEFVVQNGTVAVGSAPVIYEFQLDDEDPNFSNPSDFHAPRSSGTQTTAQFSDGLATDMTFYWRVRATDGSFATEWSAVQTFQTPSVTAGPRTPDPAPGSRLPLPNESATIKALAAMHPTALADSCQEDGGTWEFMDLALEKLRSKDTRWGFNCKRGDCNHISLDVVDYFWGVGDGLGSTQVYIIDIIGGHCGAHASAAWFDQTDATFENGDVGRWTYPR